MAARQLTLASALAGLAMLAACTARAQARIEPEPTPALACLTVTDGEPGEPVYPFDPYKRGEAGRVKANVTLPGGLLGNTVEILASEGDAAFVDSSRRFLRSLQAPCLKKGETATLTYEFVFDTDRRQVSWNRPRDVAESAGEALRKCIRNEKPGSTPEYPEAARRIGLQGRVLAVLTFTSPDGEPQVELGNRAEAKVFLRAVRTWALAQRMPCHPATGPVAVRQLFVFRLDRTGAFGFNVLTLPELLSATKGIRDRELALDTTTMGCPFDLKFTYYQPFRPNLVGEVGSGDPRRRPLLDLLAGSELKLPEDVLDSVFADTADVTVPCLRINLNPKEKSS